MSFVQIPFKTVISAFESDCLLLELEKNSQSGGLFPGQPHGT